MICVYRNFISTPCPYSLSIDYQYLRIIVLRASKIPKDIHQTKRLNSPFASVQRTHKSLCHVRSENNIVNFAFPTFSQIKFVYCFRCRGKFRLKYSAGPPLKTYNAYCWWVLGHKELPVRIPEKRFRFIGPNLMCSEGRCRRIGTYIHR